MRRFLFLLLVLVLASCAPAPTVTPAPTPIPTPRPTETPLPTCDGWIKASLDAPVQLYSSPSAVPNLYLRDVWLSVAVTIYPSTARPDGVGRWVKIAVKYTDIHGYVYEPPAVLYSESCAGLPWSMTRGET